MQQWKKGRGKLGIFEPLLGRWQAQAETPRGPLICTRVFEKVLAGSHVRLDAHWGVANKPYIENAMFGLNSEKTLCFWSFTSDGKQSQGRQIAVEDIHPLAIGFEARMPAGLARMVYWPHDEQGFYWIVESKNKTGWKRFVEHHYVAVRDQASP